MWPIFVFLKEYIYIYIYSSKKNFFMYLHIFLKLKSIRHSHALVRSASCHVISCHYDVIGLTQFLLRVIYDHCSLLIHADAIGHTPFLTLLIAFLMSLSFLWSRFPSSMVHRWLFFFVIMDQFGKNVWRSKNKWESKELNLGWKYNYDVGQ